MLKLKDRHWVFIAGFIMAVVSSIWSESTSSNIVTLLFLMGIGLFLKDIFQGE